MLRQLCIEDNGESCLIVSANTGKALTNVSVSSVPANNGVEIARRGRGSTDITIDSDNYIAGEIPSNIIWNFTEDKVNPYPGSYTKDNKWTGFTIRNTSPGTGAGTNALYRESSSSTNTAPIRTDGTGDVPNSIWFVAPINPKTGTTAIFTYNSTNSYLLPLFGAPTGFVAQGGTGGSMSLYASKAPVKRDEYFN